jgi:uncharacterized protein (UPF0248 family)
MRTSHTRLLRLYHDPQYDFGKVSVDYINRGAPGNRSTILGDGIHSLESGGMEIESAIGTTFVPYHRILKILYDGNLIWERGKKMEEESRERLD